MANKHGSLSINSENIFPIIKKWLYSDHDIFVRELVSNGCDAITKLKKLEMMGEIQLPDDNEFKVRVLTNAEDKTLTFIDNGIGMTADEVEEYINQIAFSGAEAFLEKYKDKTNEDQIIGHFGLGFYSAFMVADKVTIDSLSYQEGAAPVHWECDGGTDFDMTDGDYTERGTKITLYLNEDCLEFSNEYRVREVLDKYCSFMPVPIFLENEKAEPQYENVPDEEVTEKDTVIEHFVEEAKTREEEKEDGTKETVEISPARNMAKIVKRPVPINDTTPLWGKHPNECTEEEYRDFYRKVFHDYKEPLFWIHLNMDYPFNLKGILYFPKINTEYESIEGTIKLYNNQVFIADNIKEVIPEFLMLLKGVIDCPDLPLNVSRSALQNDGFVKKISDYITKKVADKLSGMCKTEKESYEKYWDDISPFIKFGCIKDEKFCEKMSDYILFKNLDDKYLTLKEFIEENKPAEEEPEVEVVNADGTSASETEAKESEHEHDHCDCEDHDHEHEEKEDTLLYYVTDPVEQSQYINMFRKEKIDAVLLTHNIDQPFISQLEQKNPGIKFLRIDTDLTTTFKEETESDEAFKETTEQLTALFKKVLENDNLTVQVERLKDESISSMITLSEETRRMQDMMKMYNMYGMGMGDFGGGETLVLNANNALVQYVLANAEGEHTPMICKQLYDLAMISHGPLKPEAMTAFIARSNEILQLLTK